MGIEKVEDLKDEFIEVVAASVNIGISNVTLSVVAPEPVIIVLVKTGKQNHGQILSKMKSMGYRSILYGEIKNNRVLNNIVQTMPAVGEPVVLGDPRKLIVNNS